MGCPAGVDMVRLLLDAGARTDIADRKGWLPLSEAVSCGLHEVVVMLLGAGADPNKPDNTGTTPMMLAYKALACPFKNASSLDIVKALEAAGGKA